MAKVNTKKNHAEEETGVKDFGKIYIFKAIEDKTVTIKPSQYKWTTKPSSGQPVRQISERAIKIQFNHRHYVLNEAEAAVHGLTIDDMFELITSDPQYGKSFICVSGPDIEITEDVKKFEARADANFPKVPGVKSGPKDTESLGGR